MVPTAEGRGRGGAGQPWRHSRAPHEATSARRHGAHKRDCRELSKPPAQEHAAGRSHTGTGPRGRLPLTRPPGLSPRGAGQHEWTPGPPTDEDAIARAETLSDYAFVWNSENVNKI